MWKKALIHLGLGDDADYEQYHTDGAAPPPPVAADPAPRASTPSGPPPAPHHPPHHQPAASSAPEPLLPSYPDELSAIGEVRPITTRAQGGQESVMGAVQPVSPSVTPGALTSGQSSVRPRPQVVRPVPITANAKPHVVVPASFNQAQDVADKFKSGQPVVVNLQGADRDLARRLIDFASGLCYGLGGQMERLVSQVYLLTPSNVEVGADERRRLADRGYEP